MEDPIRVSWATVIMQITAAAAQTLYSEVTQHAAI